MEVIKRVIFDMLKEAYERGAFGIHDLFKSIQGLQLKELHSDGRGRVISWYRSDQDGKLYEVIISPVNAAITELPVQLRPKQNTNEPFTAEDVKQHIENSMRPLIYGVNLMSDNSKHYDFKLIFDRRVISKEEFIKALEKRTMVSPYTFKIMNNDATENVILRYVKS